METETVKATYAGSGWLKENLKYVKSAKPVGKLGERVADLLGELFYGIYHLDHQILYRVDWSNERFIEINIDKSLSTYDFDELTRLVFLAHHLSIRVQISSCNFRFLKLLFHSRDREHDINTRHPYLDEAVAKFHKEVNLPEFG